MGKPVVTTGEKKALQAAGVAATGLQPPPTQREKIAVDHWGDN
jgi:hypothetical protein